MLSRRYAEPLWTTRFGALRAIEFDLRETWQTYNRGHTMAGEDIGLRVAFERGGTPVNARWRTRFPSQTTRSQTWAPAIIDATEAVVPALAGDPLALERMATEDPTLAFRLAAIRRMTAKPVLTRLAEADADAAVRSEARSRLNAMR